MRLFNKIQSDIEEAFPNNRLRVSLLETLRKITMYEDFFQERGSRYIEAVNEEDFPKALQIYLEEKSNDRVYAFLGEGSFAYTYLGFSPETYCFTCIKVVTPDKRSRFRQHFPDFDAEDMINFEKKLGQIFHDNLVEVLDTKDTGEGYIIKMEFFPGITLNKCFRKCWELNEKQKLELWINILRAVRVAHKHEYVHNDIHCSNVLVDIFGNHKVKLIDYGMSRKINTKLENPEFIRFPNQAMHLYRDPRLSTNDCYLDKALDIWSLGVLASILFNRRFFDISNYQPSNATYNSLREADLSLTKDQKEIIENMLDENPTNRPFISEVYKEFNTYLEITKADEISENAFCRLLSDLQYALISEWSGKICIDTNIGKAFLYFRNGVLLDAQMGDISGQIVLENILQGNVTIFSSQKDDAVNFFPKLNESLVTNDDYDRILANRQLERDNLFHIKGKMKNIVRQCLGIDSQNYVIKCPECPNNCPNAKSDIRYLELGYGFFLSGNSNNKVISCKQHLIEHANSSDRGIRLNTRRYSNNLLFLFENNIAKFYLNIWGNQVKKTILYRQTDELKRNPEEWKRTIKRLSRSYKILRKNPSPYMTSVYSFKERNIGQDTFVVLETEYFAGITLKQVLDTPEIFNELSLSDKIVIMLSIAKALEQIHDLKIIHRNVSPESVLIGVDGSVKLDDFSLCKYTESHDAAGDITQITQVSNPNENYTIHNRVYQSVEQITSIASCNDKSDVWSWGAIAYEMLTGKKAFERNPRNEYLKFRKEKLSRLNKSFNNHIIAQLTTSALQAPIKERPKSDKIVQELSSFIYSEV